MLFLRSREFMKLKLLALLLIIQQLTNAQNYFSATIKDSLSDELLIGATVVEQGSNNGASTDINGNIKLAVSKSGNVSFLVSYIGYNSKIIDAEIPQKNSPLIILLSSNAKELGEVTVTSIRTNSRIEDIPTRVEILGLDDLNEENGVKPGNIMSLLGDIAGIQMQQVSASSGNTFARIQGLNGRYTQLLKDGMPLFSGLSGSFGILQIPPLDLKQIEIIKGSASTLYGGDAIGGIINLVSKSPSEKQEFTFTVNQSSLLETNLNGYCAKRFGKIGVTLFAGQTFQKEKDIDKDGLTDVPNVNSTVVHPKLVFFFNPKSTLTLNYTATFDKRMGGDLGYFKPNSSDTLYHINNSIQRHSGDAKWMYEFSKVSSITAKFSSSYLSQNLRTKFYSFDATQLIYFSEASYLKTSKKTDWVFGINFNGDIFNNNTQALKDIKDYNYQTLGGFIQNTWRLSSKLISETGLRIDYHSKYKSFALPRLSFVYKFNKEFTGRINGGFGYKTPVLLTYLNPETDLNKISTTSILNSELSRGINADINYVKLLNNELSVTINQSLFFTNISHPIDDSSSAPSMIKLLNENEALQTQGLQTYMRLHYKTVELYLGYVFTDVKKLYDLQHHELPVTPKHNFSSVFFYEPDDHWRMGIESSLIAGQLDQNYVPVKNYFLLAAMVQYNIGKFSFVLNAENMLDFRQNKTSRIYDGTVSNPEFHKLWAPIDGRVINLSVKIAL